MVQDAARFDAALAALGHHAQPSDAFKGLFQMELIPAMNDVRGMLQARTIDMHRVAGELPLLEQTCGRFIHTLMSSSSSTGEQSASVARDVLDDVLAVLETMTTELRGARDVAGVDVIRAYFIRMLKGMLDHMHGPRMVSFVNQVGPRTVLRAMSPY